MKRDARRLLWATLGVAWLFILVIGYYVAHKPVTPTLAYHLASSAGHVAFGLVLVCLAGGIGRRLIGGVTLPSRAEPFLHAAFGLGALSLAYLLLGATIGVRVWLAWGLLGVACLTTWWDILAWSKQAIVSLASLRPAGKFETLILVCIASLLALGLVAALAPPVRFDALVYHLALPKSYLQIGRVAFQPVNLYSGMPQAGEMLYTLGMACAGEEAAAVLGWFCALLALWGLAGFLVDHFGGSPAWAGAASLMAGASLSLSTSWAYVDWIALLFGTGLLVSLVNWRIVPSRGRLALVGAFAGLALGTKYSAGFMVLATLAVILWASWRAKRKEEDMAVQGRWAGMVKSLRAGLIFGLAALLSVAPWWLKNFLSTGNPLSPFLFAGQGMNAFHLAWLQGSGAPLNWQEAALLPLGATLLGGEGAPGFSASIGPLLLGLAPLAFLGIRHRQSDQRLLLQTSALLSLVGTVIWSAAGTLSELLSQTRLYFALFPALASLAGVGLVTLDGYTWRSLRLGRLARATVLLVLGLTMIEVWVDALARETPQAMAGVLEDRAYLEKNLGWYTPAMQAVADLPPGSRVQLLWEPRSYHCLPACDPDELLDAWVIARRGDGEMRSTKQILSAWHREGYTHLLVYTYGADYFRQSDLRYYPEDWQALQALLASLSAPLDFGGVYELYALTP